METNNNKFYTAGKFAKKAGVTLRAIRFYDKKGILKPSEYSESGYRLYSDKDLAKLQKVLTLKFLGFSLDDIKSVMKDNLDNQDFKSSLKMQKQAIQTKIDHMAQIIKAINETEDMLDKEDTLDWARFTNIINVINLEKVLLQQFKSSVNLSNRISLHDKFSTNQYGWHRWVYDRINFFSGARILELGCGDGSLWSKNIDRIPKDCEITLTDTSEGMLEDAKRNLGTHSNQFTFKVVDALNIPFQDNSFDIVIANHMFYYISDRQKAFSQINRVLNDGGCFYTSTMGKDNMKELYDIVRDFDDRLIISRANPGKNYCLENGKEQLIKCFNHINLYRYEDSLKVTDAECLVDYVCSATGNIREILTEERIEELGELLRDMIKDEGSIFIRKDAGIFEVKNI